MVNQKRANEIGLQKKMPAHRAYSSNCILYAYTICMKGYTSEHVFVCVAVAHTSYAFNHISTYTLAYVH